MRNAEYWARRFAQLGEAQEAIGRDALAEVESLYRRAEREAEGQLAAWYRRFADGNGVSLAEARRRLAGRDLEEFRWDVREYIRHGEENALDGRWMRELENASAKFHVSRLEALTVRLRESMEELFARQGAAVSRAMGRAYRSGYYHTAFEIQKGFGIGWDIAGVDQARVEKVLAKPWAADGVNFSERIWKNKDRLIQEVHRELSLNVMTGADPQKAIDSLAKKMNASKRSAGRLVMTEEAYFSSLSQGDCFRDLGVERYEVVATLDSHTSETCREMDGKVFPMSEYRAGETAPPFHVWCRSTTAPHFDDDFGQIGERAARGGDGKTYHVPADMTYKDWQKSFAGGGSKEGLREARTLQQAIDDSRKEFAPASTMAEAEEFAKRFIGGGLSKTFKNRADYKGISLESANEINRTLYGLYENLDLPKLNGIKAVSPTSAQGKKAFKDGADAVAAYNPAEQGIFLNKDVLKSAKAYEEHQKEAADAWDTVMGNIDKLTGSQKELALTYKKAGRSLVDESVGGAITHEVGHHVAWQALDAATNNAVGGRMKEFAPKISGYANASKGEYLAESFSAYAKGEREKLDPKLVEALDEKFVGGGGRDGLREAEIGDTIKAEHPKVESVEDVQTFEEMQSYMKDSYGVAVDDSVGKLDFKSVWEGVQGIEYVIQEFPQARPAFKSIGAKKSGGMMCAEYDGSISFNPGYYQTRKTALRSHGIGEGAAPSGLHPKGSNCFGSGSHEAGHILEKALIDKDSGESVIGGIDWDDGAYAKAIVSDACKEAKKLPECKGMRNIELQGAISTYAKENESECLAEAVCDFALNGEDAAPLSRIIWKILKKELG